MDFDRVRRAAQWIALFSLVACATRAHTEAPAVHFPRIVALAPSLVDDCMRVGAAGQLVAVSKFTNAPASIPRVADFRTVDTEEIVALHPDIVLGITSQERLVDPLRRAGIHVVLVRDDTYDEIFSNIHAVGVLSGHAAQANALIDRLQRTTRDLQLKTRRFSHRPSVFVALGTGPIWTAGPTSYLGHLLVLAGGRDAATLAQPWGQYSEEALVAAQPDAIVSDRETDVRAVMAKEPWRSLRAVREGSVFVVTDPSIVNALFRPGPNYNEGLRWLIERLTPLAT